MSGLRPVIAAIPNYNHGAALSELLPTVLEQEYAGVVVCDDASSDTSLELLEPYKNDIEIVAGAENKGAGLNRNRVLGSNTLQRLGTTSLIHFLDADSLLISDRNPERVNDVMASPNAGIVGASY